MSRRAPSASTPTKIYCKTSQNIKCCLVCGTTLPANSSFYNLSHVGLLENLQTLLETVFEGQHSIKYVCKPCYRRADMLVKKRDVLQSLMDEFRGKFLNTSRTLSLQSQRECYTYKRLSHESPQERQKKKRKTMSPRTRAVRTSLFNSQTRSPSSNKENVYLNNNNPQQNAARHDYATVEHGSPMTAAPKKLDERQIKVRYTLYITFRFRLFI